MIPLNILIAIPYLDKGTSEFLQNEGNKCTILLDSGAFTYWKKGKEIPLSEYTAFLNKLSFKPWRYFTLDVVGDPKRTKENFRHLLSDGFKPVPIFTRGDSVEELQFYYANSDLVAIGGLVQTQGNKGFVKGIMKHVGNKKVHWLGFTQGDFLGHFKPYSCDSSSWAGAVRYGRLQIYIDNGKWITVTKESFIKKPNEQILKIFSLYEEDPRRLSKSIEWINTGRGDHLLEVMTCKSWVRFQLDVQAKLGVKYFLACASIWQIKQMVSAYKFWINKLNLDT